jgi:hypothetical protein
MATYYIDTNSLATATSIWTNANLTIKAPNGFYQKDGVYRQMSGGELLPIQNCPDCFYSFGSSLVAGSSATACGLDITETYYFDNVDGGVGESEPEVGDLVFSDSEGTTPLGVGFYKMVSGNYIQVDSSGEVIAVGTCPSDEDQFTIYFDVTTTPNTYGWSNSTAACAGTGTPLTVYIIGGSSSLYDAVITDGKALYINAGRTILLAGGNTWFKTTSAPATGETFQVSSVGEVPLWGGTC